MSAESLEVTCPRCNIKRNLRPDEITIHNQTGKYAQFQFCSTRCMSWATPAQQKAVERCRVAPLPKSESTMTVSDEDVLAMQSTAQVKKLRRKLEELDFEISNCNLRLERLSKERSEVVKKLDSVKQLQLI